MGDAGRRSHVGRAMTRVNFHPAGTQITAPATLIDQLLAERARGVTLPAGAVWVGRPSRWGNPFGVVPPGRGADPSWKVLWSGEGPAPSWGWPIRHDTPEPAHAAAVAAFRRWIAEPEQAGLLAAGRRELAGKDLACACPVGTGPACHADVWLELAGG